MKKLMLGSLVALALLPNAAKAQGFAPVNIKLQTDTGYVTVPASLIDSVEVVVRDYRTGNSTPACTVKEKANLDGLIQGVAFDSPQEVGLPGGILSGKIILHFSKAANLKYSDRYFIIENNEIVQDMMFPNVTYRNNMVLDLNWSKSAGCN